MTRPAPSPRRSRIRFAAGILLLLSLVPLGAVVVLSRLGQHHWSLDLLSHFQAQYAAALAVVVVLAACFRAIPALILSGLLLLLPLFQLAYYYPSRHGPDTAGKPELRIISFNILRTNQGKEAVRDWLLGNKADVLVLFEIDEAWSEALEPVAANYPHRTSRLRSDNFGAAIYSKFPLSAEAGRVFGVVGPPCLMADVEWPAATFRLFAVHPVPPVGARASSNRNTYLERLAPLIASEEIAAVAAGDFNCSPFSSHFRDFIRDSGLTDSGRGKGLRATWNRENPLAAIPIDHVLHTPHFTCTRRAVGPALGSDHRAVLATLAMIDPAPPQRRKRPPARTPPRRPPAPPEEAKEKPPRIRRVPTPPE